MCIPKLSLSDYNLFHVSATLATPAADRNRQAALTSRRSSIGILASHRLSSFGRTFYETEEENLDVSGVHSLNGNTTPMPEIHVDSLPEADVSAILWTAASEEFLPADLEG